MSSNNTYDTKCDMTPARPPNLKFLMEPMSILASLGLNLVWFTSISKLTNGSHPDYDQGCRLGELLRVGEGGGPLGGEEPLRSSHLGPGGLFLLGTPGTLHRAGAIGTVTLELWEPPRSSLKLLLL